MFDCGFLRRLLGFLLGFGLVLDSPGFCGFLWGWYNMGLRRGG